MFAPQADFLYCLLCGFIAFGNLKKATCGPQVVALMNPQSSSRHRPSSTVPCLAMATPYQDDPAPSQAGQGSEAPKLTGPQRSQEPTNQLFVGNLPYSFTPAEVRQHFALFGDVQSVRLPRSATGGNRGFGFVTFTSVEAAQAAFNEERHEIGGRSIKVSFSTPQAPMEKVPDRPVTYCVAWLRSTTTGATLLEHFNRFGDIKQAHIVYENPSMGIKSRRLGYITIEDPEVAEQVRENRKKHIIDGVVVQLGVYDHKKDEERCVARLNRLQRNGGRRNRDRNGNFRGGQPGGEDKKQFVDAEKINRKLSRLEEVALSVSRTERGGYHSY
uniref:RRM domain-containing protein n=1 Tax=Steinernema glaseri TaxID=37863 RepID=A0A1I7Y1G6_9BILA